MNDSTQLAIEISKVIKKYKQDEVAESSKPAMGGYGTARSTIGGKIKAHVNFNNGSNSYLLAVTVGGGINKSIREQIFEEARSVFELFANPESIHEDSGTNYSTIGIRSKYSFNPTVTSRLEELVN